MLLHSRQLDDLPYSIGSLRRLQLADLLRADVALQVLNHLAADREHVVDDLLLPVRVVVVRPELLPHVVVQQESFNTHTVGIASVSVTKHNKRKDSVRSMKLKYKNLPFQLCISIDA